MKIQWLSLWVMLAWLTYGCATDSSAPKNAADEDSEEESNSSNSQEQEENDEVYVSTNFKSMTYSAKNNPLTSKTINKAKAKDLIDEISGKLKKPTQKDRNELVGLIVLHTLANDDLGTVMRATKTLIELEMSKDIARDVPTIVKLQLALAAIEKGNFALAEYYLPEVLSSKSAKMKAAAYTAEGYIALSDDRMPEAVALWNEALKVMPGFEPALLNIGYFSLKYGDHVTAKQMLSRVEDDWFADAGMLIAERIAGNVEKVSSLCESFKEKKKDYKPVMFSCALNAYQGEKKYDEALALLKELVQSGSSPSTINEKAQKLMAEIEREKNRPKAEP